MLRIFALLVFTLAIAACNSDAGPADDSEGNDTSAQPSDTADSEPDAVDTLSDALSEQDAGDDVLEPDAVDAEPDVAEDVLQPDSGPDADVEPDAETDTGTEPDAATDTQADTGDIPDADSEPVFPTVIARGTVDGAHPQLAERLEAGDRFARSIALLDDSLEGGGVLLAIGARSDDDGVVDAGAVYILELSDTGALEATAKISALEGGLGADVLRPDGEPLFFGYGNTGIGDLDGDGIQDLGTTAPQDVDGGSIYVITLNEDRSVKTATRTSGLRGEAITFLGDLVGDARPEIAVADPTATVGRDRSAGSVQLHSLNPDGTLSLVATWDSASSDALAGVVGGDNFGGRTIVPIGDLDGDGLTELAVGAFRADDDRGAIWILFLDAEGQVREATEIADGIGGLPAQLAEGDNFGHAAVAVGDVDGDGIPDLLTSANRADGDTGALYFLLLARDGTLRSHQRLDAEDLPDFAIAEGERFGRSMAAIGTMSGDNLWVAIGGGARTTGNFRLLEITR